MLTITVQDAEVRAGLAGLLRALDDPRPALAAIGQAIVTASMETFSNQADPWGTPWAGHSETTLLARGKRAVRGQRLTTNKGNTRAPALRAMLSAQILRDTGVLANSISAQVGRDQVRVGTGDIRAGTHQFGAGQGAYGRTRRGGPIPWGDIPARPFLPIRDGGADLPGDLREAIVQAMHDFLAAAA